MLLKKSCTTNDKETSIEFTVGPMILLIIYHTKIQATNHDINLEFKLNLKNKNAHIHTTNQRINCFSLDKIKGS
jgi:hypothetical protein